MEGDSKVTAWFENDGRVVSKTTNCLVVQELASLAYYFDLQMIHFEVSTPRQAALPGLPGGLEILSAVV